MNEENKQVDSIFKEDENFELHKTLWQQRIRRAKHTLFVIGILIFLIPIIAALRFDEFPDLYAGVYVITVSGLFIGLGIWANRSKPYTAIMAGLIFFIVYLASAIVLRGITEGIAGAF